MERTTYAIRRVLGEGGIGRVYEAVRETGAATGRRVAVKILHDAPSKKALERFRDEARILSMIRDRAVVWADSPVLLDVGWAVVMDLAPGADLARVRDLHGAVPAAAALEIAAEVARCLHNLWHQDGPNGPLRVLHRDLKPSNLQVSRSGEVRVLDFGTARANFEQREARTTQHIAGTPGYIAPERLIGVDGPEGDVYSLGIVLHELCTGGRPAPGRVTTPTLALLPSGGEPPKAPQGTELPPGVRELVEAMTVSRPAQRPSAQQVARQCRDLLKSSTDEPLADWADRVVATSVSSHPPDARVGKVVTVVDQSP